MVFSFLKDFLDLFFEPALHYIDFKFLFGVEGAWDGILGEGLLNFNKIFQKTWAEPGNLS